MRIQLAVPDNDFLSAETLQPGLHGPRLGDDVPVRGADLRGVLDPLPAADAGRARPAVPAALGVRLLGFPASAASSSAARSSSTPRRAAAGSCIRRSPPAISPDIGADIWLLGFSFIEVAAIAAAVELIVGVLKCRPPGMRINLIPLYSWYVLVAAAMVLFAFPPLIAGQPAARARARVRLAVLRSDARRRSAAVAAPVLDLRPSRGLHHLPAVGRARRDDRADLRAHADRRLQLDRARGRRHRLPELRPVGAPHVHDRACRASRSASSRPRRRRWRFRPACSSSASSRRCSPAA